VQLTTDEILYTDAGETPQWVLYYISKPLVGFPDPASIPKVTSLKAPALATQDGPKIPAFASSYDQPPGDDFLTLSELFNTFPAIARHMQPGLERLFQQFNTDIGRKESDRSRQSLDDLQDVDSTLERTASVRSGLSRTSSYMSRTLTRTSTILDQEENYLRGLAETLVMSAIDIFQSVDKQQLASLAAATNLSGPVIERMIERHVMEHVHDHLLFPRICALMAREDQELDHSIRGMRDVDISQVGIVEGDKEDHSRRVLAAMAAFKKMGITGSPSEMVDVVLQTEKCLATRVPSSTAAETTDTTEQSNSAQISSVVATNADTLVSLLLMVIIRTQIRSLHARLVYMRDFSFIEDVESGELGYALSTFEAVLSYLSSTSKALRKVSKTNRSLWQAIKQGKLAAVRKALEPSLECDDSTADGDLSSAETASWNGHVTFKDENEVNPLEIFTSPMEDSSLAHVFPWNTQEEPPSNDKPKKKKRVSMDVRRLSSASMHSTRSTKSRSSTIGSMAGSIVGSFIIDTSPQQLCQTTDDLGHSLLMMAVEHNQVRVLDYLLQLSDLFTVEQVLSDQDHDHTTLLSAAVQAGRKPIVMSLLRWLTPLQSDAESFPILEDYLSRKDSKGRCVAHYISDAPYLIRQYTHSLPWQLKDNNGQTPLFSLCRSYDVESYFEFVIDAIDAAIMWERKHGGDGVLHLDDHVDKKGNTLLHIVTDSRLIRRLLYQCDSDPNACNDKHFTPLMLASKFARTDLVRILFGDNRVDLQARDFRGLTAIELAKDDEIRNRIDDMALLLAMPASVHQKTTIVRSFFVEDGSIRLVLKSGSRNANNTITVTTCRRSLLDFENLAQWLALEHPASWMPSIFNARSPFQIPSKPSRQMLRDLQLRLDAFLQSLLTHSTFATHETLWEFILIPDIDSSMLVDRAHRKAQLRLENLRDGAFDPMVVRDEVQAFEIFLQHARSQLVSSHNAYRAVFRRAASLRTILADLAEANQLAAQEASRTLSEFMPECYIEALTRAAKSHAQTEASPITQMMYGVLRSTSATAALVNAFARPTSLVRSLRLAQADFRGHMSNLPPSTPSKGRDTGPATRFLALLDGSTTSTKRENEIRNQAAAARSEVGRIGAELRYSQMTVASELAGWQSVHEKDGRQLLKETARKMVVVEKERLRGLERVIRDLGKAKQRL